MVVVDGMQLRVHPAFGSPPRDISFGNILPGSGSGDRAPLLGGHTARGAVGLEVCRVACPAGHHDAMTREGIITVVLSQCSGASPAVIRAMTPFRSNASTDCKASCADHRRQEHPASASHCD